MPKNETVSPTRAALYIRVSTEEQAMRGYSLEAQREVLESHAKSHGMLIAGYYQDEAKSARKPCRVRPACMRLLSDVEAGKIDLILFIKLDRWFRNVADYYEVQKILDAHVVHWQTVLEDYETITSSSVRATAAYIRQAYGQNWDNVRCRRNLYQTLYIGHYESNGRVNENFCPPIVPRELFDAVQKLLSNNAKANPTGRAFLFTSLLICAECGHRLAGIRNGWYCYYRCRTYTERRTCPHKKQIREEDVEQWLFSFLGDQLEKQRLEWDIKEARRKQAASSVDRAAIRRKLTRLKELYVAEMIDLEEYRRDYELYTAQLAEHPTIPAEEERPNFEAVEAILAKGFHSIYDSFAPEEKRTLWRSVIKEIHVDKERQITRIVFL